MFEKVITCIYFENKFYEKYF